MQINNSTAFKTQAIPNYDKDGREVVTVIVKGTFVFSGGRLPEEVPAEEQIEIVMADEYWAEPGEPPVKYESDLAPFKPATDLIMLGFGYDPRGRMTKRVEVSFSVGQWAKKAKVTCQEPMQRIPLYFLELVPTGPKWLTSKKPKDGFGFYPKKLPPRMKYAGTYDEKWQKERSPFLPEDFDYRFFQAAFPGLICDSYLRGDEPVMAQNVSLNGPIATKLPGIGIEVEAFFESRRQKDKARLDTVILKAEERQLVLIWRLMIPIGGPPSQVLGFEINQVRVA